MCFSTLLILSSCSKEEIIINAPSDTVAEIGTYFILENIPIQVNEEELYASIEVVHEDGELINIYGGMFLVEKIGIYTVKYYISKERIEASNKFGVIYRLQFEIISGIRFYGILFLPNKLKDKNPFVIVQHGGYGTPEHVGGLINDSGNYNNMVFRMCERGAVVFAPQLMLWKPEELGSNYNRDELDMRLRQVGGSLTGMELLFMRLIIDYFINVDYVNKNNFGICGLSWGMYALHIGAIDKRIKAVWLSFNNLPQV